MFNYTGQNIERKRLKILEFFFQIPKLNVFFIAFSRIRLFENIKQIVMFNILNNPCVGTFKQLHLVVNVLLHPKVAGIGRFE